MVNAYGAALNEGRALFPVGDNSRFSEWLANGNLPFEVEEHERAAAMWAAAFGEWVDMCQLDTYPDGTEIDRHDRAAAMWAAAFGEWIVDEQLVRLHADRDVFQAERAAAMWAAANPDEAMRWP